MLIVVERRETFHYYYPMGVHPPGDLTVTTQPKTDLAYLRNEKAKAEQKLRSCQNREKILERRMSELNRRERVHRLCTRAGIYKLFFIALIVKNS